MPAPSLEYMNEGFIHRPSTLNDYRERGGTLLGQARLAAFPATSTLVAAGELERIIITNIQITHTTLFANPSVAIYHKPKGIAIGGVHSILNINPTISWVTYSNATDSKIYLAPEDSLLGQSSVADRVSVSVYGVRLNANV